MQAPDFWDDPKKSAPLLRKRRGVERQRDTLVRLRRDADDLAGWRELLAEGEADEEAVAFVEDLEKELDQLELELMLAGPDDALNALISIHPGAGGTESQDWAEMLERMYLRYCEAQGFAIELIERQDGEEAGPKADPWNTRACPSLSSGASESGAPTMISA